MNAGLLREARIDLGAVRANAIRLVDAFGPGIADLRSDAYGHGLLPVARALAAAGVSRVAVSHDADVAAVSEAGIRAETVIVPPSVDAAWTAEHARFGLGVYGLGRTEGLRPALTLVGQAVQVKRVAAGRGVSYGYTYRMPREGTLVLVALGYADGIPRAASNRAPVSFGGVRARVSGRIAMDQFVVDVGDEPARIGQEVVLFGDGAVTASDWAEATGIRAEAILAGLGARIRRVYREGGRS